MMNIEEIRERIDLYKSEGKKLFATSSFQTHSIPMLHIISQIDSSIPIYYLNTGFLFAQTIQFKNELKELLGLDIIGVSSQVPKLQQKDNRGQFYFTSDPDYCCSLNKTQPMEPLLIENDVWINGVRKDQNSNRANMKVEAKTPQGCLRYHPMLDWTSKDIFDYRKKYNLPENPLDKLGYVSVGCEPCTVKMDLNSDERNSRWFGMNKIECGLHTDLIVK